jgi:hypothetical protein
MKPKQIFRSLTGGCCPVYSGYRLQHIVVDELHLYRGTAGTEVAYESGSPRSGAGRFLNVIKTFEQRILSPRNYFSISW